MDWEKWKGKRIFIILNSTNKDHKNIVYSGTVKDVDNNFISILDRYGYEISINTSEIKLIKEE